MVKNNGAEVFVTALISVMTAVLVFWGNYSELKAQVMENTQGLSKKVDESELKVIVQSQEKMSGVIEKRLDRMENKIDKLNEKVR
jgi:hypothetical protein